MRRMLTETEVEKLDSIKPSEIEKLGKITNADIESVQAMQSPKDAITNYVLTADGNGKAFYRKPATAGSKIHSTTKTIPSSGRIETGERGTFLEVQLSASHVISVYFYQPLKIKNGDTWTTMDESCFKMVPYITGMGGWDFAHIYFTADAITKYSITADSQFNGVIHYDYYD